MHSGDIPNYSVVLQGGSSSEQYDLMGTYEPVPGKSVNQRSVWWHVNQEHYMKIPDPISRPVWCLTAWSGIHAFLFYAKVGSIS